MEKLQLNTESKKGSKERKPKAELSEGFRRQTIGGHAVMGAVPALKSELAKQPWREACWHTIPPAYAQKGLGFVV